MNTFETVRTVTQAYIPNRDQKHCTMADKKAYNKRYPLTLLENGKVLKSFKTYTQVEAFKEALEAEEKRELEELCNNIENDLEILEAFFCH